MPNYSTVGIIIDHNCLVNMGAEWLKKAVKSTINKFINSYNTQAVLIDLVPGIDGILNDVIKKEFSAEILPVFSAYNIEKLWLNIPNIQTEIQEIIKDCTNTNNINNAWSITSNNNLFLNNCDCVFMLWNGISHGKCAHAARRALEINKTTLLINYEDRDIKMLSKDKKFDDLLPCLSNDSESIVDIIIDKIHNQNITITDNLLTDIQTLVDYIYDFVDFFMISLDQSNVYDLNRVSELLSRSTNCLKYIIEENEKTA